MKKTVALLMVVSLMIVGFVGFKASTSESYALVSIDINPSFGLVLDENGKVIEAIPQNSDAESYEGELVGLDVTEAIDDIIAWAEEKEFLNEENDDVLIASANLTEEKSEELSELIEAYIENNHEESKIKVLYIASDKETAEASLEDGESLGKTELKNQLMEKSAEGFEADDEEDLFESTLGFISRLETMFGDKEELPKDYSDFLEKYQIKFDVENYGLIEEQSDLAEIKDQAKILWLSYKGDYKKQFAMLKGEVHDENGSDMDLYESALGFIRRLKDLEMTDDINSFMTTYALDFEAEDFGLTEGSENLWSIKTEAKDLWKEAKNISKKEEAALRREEKKERTKGEEQEGDLYESTLELLDKVKALGLDDSKLTDLVDGYSVSFDDDFYGLNEDNQDLQEIKSLAKEVLKEEQTESKKPNMNKENKMDKSQKESKGNKKSQ